MLQKVSCVERACSVLSFILGLPAPGEMLPSCKGGCSCLVRVLPCNCYQDLEETVVDPT